MPLKDLVLYLGTRRASGQLALELEGGSRNSVALHEGAVVSAGSNRPREYLGQFLINMGKITEDQFHRAYERQQKTNVLLGKILEEEGLVTEADLLNALNLKFRETLLSAFTAAEGTFAFVPQDGPLDMGGVTTRVDLLEIAREGEFRETAWSAIRAVFPHGDLRLKARRENLAEPPKPGSLDERLIQLIEDGASIDELVLALHATDFFLYQRLYALYRLEAVAVLDGAPKAQRAGEAPGVVGAEPSPGEVLRRARELLEQGDSEEAVVLGRRSLELGAGPEGQALVKQAEGILLKALGAELLRADRVPSLEISPAEVKKLPLSAAERYLMSRIDGQRSIRAITQVAPVPELEALRAFKGFIRNGWVKVTGRG